jgi:hypothetical protein
MPNLDAEGQRAALLAFEQQILHPDSWLAPEMMATSHPYRAEAVSVYTTRSKAAEGVGTVEWPLAGRVSALVEPIEPSGDLCGTVTGQDLGPLLGIAASTTTASVWSDGSETYLLRFRPVLPGETACSF